MSIEVRDLNKRFGSLAVCDGLNLHIGSGELVALLGPSGSGKTTLLNVLSGFVEPRRGWVKVDGQMITGIPAHQRADIPQRARMAQRHPARLIAGHNMAQILEILPQHNANAGDEPQGNDPRRNRNRGIVQSVKNNHTGNKTCQKNSQKTDQSIDEGNNRKAGLQA